MENAVLLLSQEVNIITNIIIMLGTDVTGHLTKILKMTKVTGNIFLSIFYLFSYTLFKAFQYIMSISAETA